MLPEMFCSANDWAERPPTAVLSASKIPITKRLHIRAGGQTAPQMAAAIRRRLSQALCQRRKIRQINHLNKKPQSLDWGIIAGSAIFAENSAFFVRKPAGAHRQAPAKIKDLSS